VKNLIISTSTDRLKCPYCCGCYFVHVKWRIVPRWRAKYRPRFNVRFRSIERQIKSFGILRDCIFNTANSSKWTNDILKIRFQILFCHQNAGQNHDIKIAKRCFENVAQFRYLGRTKKIETWFRRKSRGNLIQVMPDTIQSRIFVFSSAV
jgi:hypothetical protein